MSPNVASRFLPNVESGNGAWRALNELNLWNGLIDLINFWLASFTWCTTMVGKTREKEREREPGARCEVQFQALHSVLCSFFTLLSFHGAKLYVKTPYNLFDGESTWSCHVCVCRRRNFMNYSSAHEKTVFSKSSPDLHLTQQNLRITDSLLCSQSVSSCSVLPHIHFPLLPFHSPFRVSPVKSAP